ncbi:hypothetical protein GUITHDRAFT_110724 [Guillardia theta CCMP2712]|uniref:EGF-like domain-containing protein n=1 Tax=Guillardia theta (strain CCMP2712) TaxID=905079 RepID=L1J464_GUITC|nr:hypothetical protein GUITHDRAFT_110724 [Guillardia theta CCMP2712]EKX43308.1 hypothetical protein GUITHDRAFT_110724 [Guillardia theta CCMP2712]|eukprot:XP_005830288.1 hypothetical protein GUITHDRAFT_110724 [Guillardia theta CCMP2712]
MRALEWEIRSIKQSLSATLDELRSLNSSVTSMPQLPWGNFTSNSVRCTLAYNWSQIIEKEDQGRVQLGGLGHLMQIDRFEVWVCDYDNRCVQQTGDAMCFVFDEVQEVFLPWGLDSQLLLTQQGPFQPDLAVSHILAKLKALEQEIRSGGCGGSCVSRQDVQQLLDQYYLEPGYLWSAGSFSECSSLCGSGVARRSITCISKLLEQVEDIRCSNRSKPLAEVPCLNLSQCSYEWEVGPYSECLNGCGQGLRRRSVSCRRSDGVTVEIGKCQGWAPVNEEPCSNFSSCSYRWTPSAWEACSSTCGPGLQYRSVMCVRSDGVEVGEGMCEGSKPRTFQACTGASGCNYTLINECAAHTDNCATHASCIDTYSSFECSCKPGFVGSGTVCEDVDECEALSACASEVRQAKQDFYLDVDSSSCLSCPTGQYASSLGQTSCTTCAPGFYGSSNSSCSSCPPGSSSPAGSTLVSDCQCQYGFSGSISTAADSCSPSSSAEEQSRWFRLGAVGQSCAETCAAEGKTCVSSAINQIDNEEAMRSAVRAASIASDRRIRGAMTEPQQRPGGLHLRVSAGANERGGDVLQDLTANRGHVQRLRFVEHGVTKFDLLSNRVQTFFDVKQTFHVGLPDALQYSGTIVISVTVEDAESFDSIQSAYIEVAGRRCAFTDPATGNAKNLQQIHCKLEVTRQEAMADGARIGPILISYDAIGNNGRSTWRIAVGEMKDETGEPLRVMSDGELKYVNGSINDVVLFPPLSIPGAAFTLCSISRYNGNRKNRVLQASDDSFLHGHWNGGRGQSYYYDTWILQQDLSTTADEWVVLCGQNYQYGKFFLNGVEYERSMPTLPDSLQLSINDLSWHPSVGYFLDTSDWALSEVAIWRGVLRADEIRAVSDHLLRMLSDGSSVRYNQTLNVSCSIVGSAVNKIAPYVSSDGGCYFSSPIYQSTCDASLSTASRVCLCAAPCLEDFYGQAEECFRCPFFSHSQPGSSSIRDCSCQQGRYLYVNSSDAPWGPQGSCESCPPHAWSPTGSSSVNQCQCIGGYYLDEGPSCSSCPSGLKSPYGSSSLNECMCPAGAYKSEGNCSSCPAYSTSKAGSTSVEDCFCMPGFGVKATGFSRQITSPSDRCEPNLRELILADMKGASCSQVCQSENLACVEEGQPVLREEEISLLLSTWGFPVSGIVGTNSLDAPSYNPETQQAFFRYGLPGMCGATDSSNLRICRCTCDDNQYGKTGNCSSCPANSHSSFQAQEASSCMCDSGYFFDASAGTCSLCPSGNYTEEQRFVDRDFGLNGGSGWRGTEKTSSCGSYGSVLGGFNVLGEQSSLTKTFTGLCPHGFLHIWMRVLLIDFVQPVTLRLTVDRREVWSESIPASSSSLSECGQAAGEEMIERLIRVYHTEDHVEVNIQVDYDYWEVSAATAKTFWGLKELSVVLPCSSSADCSMTSSAYQTCSDVQGSAAACLRVGEYLYVYHYGYFLSSQIEPTCKQIGRGGQLAYFPDRKTYDELRSRLSLGLYTRIGLSVERGSSYFRWTAGGAFSSQTWGDVGPQLSGDDACVVLYDNSWLPLQCSDSATYLLCSYPIAAQ